MKRRSFLKQLSLLPLASCAQLKTPISNKKKIVVVGAGLSGLSAAWDLTQKGHDVIVLEGTKRAGGRVLTSRGPWQNGQYVEWGATRISDVHNLTLHYTRQFGLDLVELPLRPRAAYYFSGHRYDYPGKDPLPLGWKLTE